jgi:hypothetical protein
VAFSPIPNSVPRKKVQVGVETVRGTAVTPDFELFGDLVVNKTTPLQDDPEQDGTYDGPGTPTYGTPQLDGSYAQTATFYDLAILPRFAVKGAVAGATDGESIPGYSYVYKTSAATDDLDSGTFVYGFDGIIYRSTGVLINELTIRGNADDASDNWMIDTRLFVRDKTLQVGLAEVLLSAVTAGPPMVLTPTGGGLTLDALIGQYVEVMSGPGASQVALITDNDTTTITLDRVLSPAPTTASTIEVSGEFTSIAAPSDRDRIPFSGTRLFIDDEGGTIGTTQIVGRFKGFSVTQNNNLNPKRMADDVGGYSAKVDRGRRLVTAQITMEYDDWREVRRWEGQETRLVRIDQQNGPVIDPAGGPATRQLAVIDLFQLYWETAREERRNNNILVTYQGRSYKDASEAAAWELTSKIPLATLP